MSVSRIRNGGTSTTIAGDHVWGWIVAVFIGLLSAGWLVPLYLAVSAYLTGFEHLLRNTESANSFPFFSFGHSVLKISAAWCLVSAVGWTAYAAHRLLASAETKQTTDID